MKVAEGFDAFDGKDSLCGVQSEVGRPHKAKNVTFARGDGFRFKKTRLCVKISATVSLFGPLGFWVSSVHLPDPETTTTDAWTGGHLRNHK